MGHCGSLTAPTPAAVKPEGEIRHEVNHFLKMQDVCLAAQPTYIAPASSLIGAARWLSGC